MDVVDQGSVGRWLRWRKIEAKRENEGERLWSKWKTFSFTPCSTACWRDAHNENRNGEQNRTESLWIYTLKVRSRNIFTYVSLFLLALLIVDVIMSTTEGSSSVFYSLLWLDYFFNLFFGYFNVWKPVSFFHSHKNDQLRCPYRREAFLSARVCHLQNKL